MRQWLIILMLFCMYAAFGAAWMAVVPLFPELETALGVSRTDAAWLVTIVSLAKSIVPILAGVVAARLGLTTTMRGAAVLMSLAVLLPFLPTFPLWVATRFLFGVGGAVWLTLMGAVVVEVVAPERRGFANALNSVAVNTGVLVGLKTALPLKDAIGHQLALVVLSVSIVMVAVVLFALGQLSSDTRGGARTTTDVKAGPPPVLEVLKRYAGVLRERTTWLVAAAFSGPLALYLVVNTWLPSYLEQTFGWTRVQAAGGLFTMNLWGVPAALLVGVALQKRLVPVRFWILVGGLLLPVASYGALVVDDSLRTLFFGLCGAALFIPVAPLITLLQRQPGMNGARFGMVMGTMGSVTYVVSSVAPNLVGSATESGVTLAAALMPCCVLGCTPLVGLFLAEPTDV